MRGYGIKTRGYVWIPSPRASNRTKRDNSFTIPAAGFINIGAYLTTAYPTILYDLITMIFTPGRSHSYTLSPKVLETLGGRPYVQISKQ